VPRFLIDVNLPYRFSVWAAGNFVRARGMGERWSDSELWAYARERGLIIVSNDTDFSDLEPYQDRIEAID
jgi:predicted nuclease of predicted toxin-antitoxin system